jgi:hypothetical protein
MRMFRDLQGRDTALIVGVTLIVAVLSLLPMARLLVELVAPQGQLSTSVQHGLPPGIPCRSVLAARCWRWYLALLRRCSLASQICAGAMSSCCFM